MLYILYSPDLFICYSKANDCEVIILCIVMIMILILQVQSILFHVFMAVTEWDLISA